MLTKMLVSVLFLAGFLDGKALGARNNSPYRNFELPKVSSSGPEGTGKLFVSQKISLKNHVYHKTPFIDPKSFLFAKEAFLSEKREEAIKLLRQQMDSGYNANRENVLLRLGQLYAEKYMELSYRETEVHTAKLLEYEKKKATGFKGPAPKPDNSRSKKYLKDALTLFYELERKFPNHPKMDEIVFFIGFVEMEGGNRTKGAGYLERVIRKYPGSRKFEEAVVYLGDYYFDRSDFKSALSKYTILVRQKEAPMHHYAVYKMAWCELNLAQGEHALRDMKGLVKALDGASDPAKFNLREQALRDLVIFYGEAGLIDDAMDFFTATIGKEKAVQNLRVIADTMRGKARDAEAIRAYQRLMQETPDSEEAPLIQLGIYESLQRLDKTQQAVDNLVLALDHYGPKSDWVSGFRGDKDALHSMLKALEDEGAKAAFFYHASAQKGTNKILYVYALRLYEALLRDFPEHPDKKKFLFFRAEVLYGQKKWLEAAESYMLSSKITPKDKMNDEAVYNALLALDQLIAKVDKIDRFTEEQQKNIDLTPREIPVGEKRFIEVAESYVADFPKGEKIVDVRYRIAAIYYRYRHFDRALDLFKKIALEHPKHRSAATAASIVLDVLNMQKNYEKLDESAQLFARTPGLGDKKFQLEMKEISHQIIFKKVEKLEAGNQWNEAGESYLTVYKSDPSGSLAEKSLYNALVSFEKANETAKTQEVTLQFITKYPKSRYTEPLLLSMAKNAEKMYDFEKARKLYYDFYRNHPKNKEARKALYNAAVFSELLEKYTAAIERYNEYLRTGRVGAEEQKAIQISLATQYRKQGNWESFAKVYRQLMRETPRLEEKYAYLAELVRQYEIAGKTGAKMDALRELRSLFISSGKDVKKAGPAARYLAELEYLSVAPNRKKYDNTILRFPVQDLVYLVGLKQRLLKQLGQNYDRVIDIGVPEWGVAALHDKAEAFAAYGASFRKLEIPKNMSGKDREDAEGGLKKLETDVVKPLDKQAEDIFKLCAVKSAEFHVGTEFARRCHGRSKAEGAVEPVGLLPGPIYFSARPLQEVGGKAPDPNDTNAYVEYLWTLNATARPDVSEKKIGEYLAQHPGEKRAVFILGVHALRAKKEALARYFFGQLEKDPTFAWTSLLLNDQGMMALADQNQPLAMEYFEKASQAQPAIVAPLVNLGSLYLQSRSYVDAERLFRRAREVDRQSEESVLGLGATLEGQGKFEAAHETYVKYIGDNSGALSVLYNDSLLLGNRMGQKEKAAQQMMRYIQGGGKESAKAQETIRNWR